MQNSKLTPGWHQTYSQTYVQPIKITSNYQSSSSSVIVIATAIIIVTIIVIVIQQQHEHEWLPPSESYRDLINSYLIWSRGQNEHSSVPFYAYRWFEFLLLLLTLLLLPDAFPTSFWCIWMYLTRSKNIAISISSFRLGAQAASILQGHDAQLRHWVRSAPGSAHPQIVWTCHDW